jgi:TetR/AcrR family transcriptional regulator, transcriptional repressor for nem operon
VTKASLHYHFPTKAELGRHLIQRYKQSFLQALADIDKTSADSVERLRRYSGLYLQVLRNDRMCLCGMLAAEYTTLPKPMKAELKDFFDENERWLVAVLEQGRAARTLTFDGTAREVAHHLMSSLEGAMMLARSYDDIARFEATANRLLGALSVGK